jgi:hypothetical protein|tara:strand:+ start:19 stop:435 length:417 start_codon:yes stop_codon:yes gene_type:complete
MSGSNVNPYQFAKNINNVEKLKDDIYDNPWINNLINNEIVNREVDVNINKRQAYYNNINNDKYDNYIYLLKILYFILVFVLIIKIVISGQKIIRKPLLIALAVIFIFPFTLDYINDFYKYTLKEVKNIKPSTLHTNFE